MAITVFTLVGHTAQPSGKPHGTVAVAGSWPRHPASSGRPLLPLLPPAQRLTDRIKQQYRVRLILDNLPITTYDLELDPESGVWWGWWRGGVPGSDGAVAASSPSAALHALCGEAGSTLPPCCSFSLACRSAARL